MPPCLTPAAPTREWRGAPAPCVPSRQLPARSELLLVVDVVSPPFSLHICRPTAWGSLGQEGPIQRPRRPSFPGAFESHHPPPSPRSFRACMRRSRALGSPRIRNRGPINGRRCCRRRAHCCRTSTGRVRCSKGPTVWQAAVSCINLPACRDFRSSCAVLILAALCLFQALTSAIRDGSSHCFLQSFLFTQHPLHCPPSRPQAVQQAPVPAAWRGCEVVVGSELREWGQGKGPLPALAMCVKTSHNLHIGFALNTTAAAAEAS